MLFEFVLLWYLFFASLCFVFSVFFFNDTATTEIYTLSDTLSLHDALPISWTTWEAQTLSNSVRGFMRERSEEHTSELQSPLNISYAVFCLKKKKKTSNKPHNGYAAAVPTPGDNIRRA